MFKGLTNKFISLFFWVLAEQSQFILLQNVVYFIKLPFLVRKIFTFYLNDVKAVPLQAWSDPESSRKLRFPDYMTTAQDWW